MGNAVWLFLALPKWYFESILSPFQAGILTAIPASGIVALALGTIVGLTGQRDSNLFWILASVVLSQIYVAIAGFFRGQFSTTSLDWPFFGLAVVQLVIVAVLVWRSHGNRVAASLLSWFGITYALYAGFIGQMAFRDTWL